ncbi:transposase [Paraburkholderia sp. GAS33]|jgi:transposase|uniref:helix-turn-helix domain-containing protein n=1 Tax=Paraburkholderia sp. GAS33 TaxID=3035130 RepID=UPI003D22D28F
MAEQRTKRDFDALSDRRWEAMALLDEGMSQSDVSRELSVTRQTVSRWAKLKAAYPDDEPWRKRPMGRPRGLTDEQKLAFVRLLADSYVRESGRRGRAAAKPARWTLARVRGLLQAQFGVSYSLAHVRNILVSLIGDDQWLLSKPRFWAAVIELAYPEYEGKVLVEDFEDGWEVNMKILQELRQALRP